MTGSFIGGLSDARLALEGPETRSGARGAPRMGS